MTARPGLSLPDWYPLIESIVPTPRTRWVRDVGDLSPLLDGLQPAGWNELLAALGGFGAELGYPLFLRSGLTSGKHDWARTCLVDTPAALGRHVAAIVEYSAMADMFGLATDDWVVRELLPTQAAFHAFGGMPITRERRYFVAGGQVYGHTPYWPPESIEAADNPRWPKLLDNLNHESSAEVEQLTALSELVSRHVPGAWSVDWLHVPSRGWFCIDMAHAELSYCWAAYPAAPAPEWWRKLEQQPARPLLQLNVKFAAQAASAEHLALLTSIHGVRQAETLFPGEQHPDLAAIYVVGVAEEEATSIMTQLHSLPNIEYAQVGATRKLIGNGAGKTRSR